MRYTTAVWLILTSLLCTSLGCTSYKSQETPFRPPQAYTNMATVAEAALAAQAYDTSTQAKEAFGFDILQAGLLPVQVVVDNQSPHGLRVVPEQTFLIDTKEQYWSLLSQDKAYARLEKSDEFARIAKGAGKSGFLGAAGGAIVGAAIGILGGEDFGTALGKGAAVGAAGGAILGGAQGGTSNEATRQISEDLAQKNLRNTTIQPGDLARGFLFFPQEAVAAKALRLQVVQTDTKKTQTLRLEFASTAD